MKHARIIWGLFILVTILVQASMVQAADIGMVMVNDVKLTQPRPDILQVVFAITNLADTVQEVSYGVRLQSTSGDYTYETPVSTTMLSGDTSRVVYSDIELPSVASGSQDVFILSRDSSGVVNILKYAGTVELEIPSVATLPARLGICTQVIEELECTVLDNVSDSIDINYLVTRGSAYGNEVASGTATGLIVEAGNVKVPLSSVVLSGGDYTHRLWLGAKADAVQSFVHIEGDPAAEDTIVGSDGHLQTVGGSGKSVDVFGVIIIVLPILVFIIFIILAFKRPRSLVLLVVLGSTGVVYAGITLIDIAAPAHIFNGYSRDSGDVQYSITLDETSFEVAETIGFSVTFQEVAVPNNKPSGGSIDIKVDSGSWAPLVTSGNSGTIYHKTVPALGSVGTHTLYFRSPDLCGGVFGESTFGSGIFGSTECLYSIPVTVVQNDPPTTPTVSGTCVLGTPCSIGLLSTDTDGNQLCYTAKWPDDSTQSAGCAVENNTVTVQHTFLSCDSASTTVRGKATDSGSPALSSAWGSGSTAVSGTITCTEPCSHCTYDGVNGSAVLQSTPAFIPPSKIVVIKWTLGNVGTCSVEGRDVASGAVVDSWDWDVVRANQQMTSSVLNGSTKYTLTCTDLAGNPASDSIVVTKAPDWQEF